MAGELVEIGPADGTDSEGEDTGVGEETGDQAADAGAAGMVLPPGALLSKPFPPGMLLPKAAPAAAEPLVASGLPGFEGTGSRTSR